MLHRPRHISRIARATIVAAAISLLAALSVLAPAPAAAAPGDIDLFAGFVGTAGPAIEPGGTTTVTAGVANASAESSTGPATVTLTLPPELTFLSGNGCSGPAAGPVSCLTSDPLAPESSQAVDIVVQLSPGATSLVGPITAQATGPDPDPKPSNNGRVGYVGVITDPTHQADVSQSQVLVPLPARAGETRTLTLTASNAGPHSALDVVLVPNLGHGMTIVGGDCAATCPIGTLAAGDSASRSLLVAIPTDEVNAQIYTSVFSATPAVSSFNGGSTGYPIAGGSISGTVVTASGSLVTSGFVSASSDQTAYSRTAPIGPDGAFSLPDVYVDSYDLIVYPGGGAAAPQPTPVVITLDARSASGLVLTVPDPPFSCPPGQDWDDLDGDGVVDPGECAAPPPAGATISGAVETPDITVVVACRGTDVVGCPFAGDPDARAASVQGGSYQIDFVPAGQWTVRGGTFDAFGSVTDYANVTLTAGQTLTCDIDATRHLTCAGFPSTGPVPPSPAPPATITGTVAPGTGITVVGACSGADQLGEFCAGSPASRIGLVSSGAFQITGIPAGTWTVRGGTFNTGGPLTDYANVTLAAGETLICDIDAARHLDCAGYTSITPPPPPPSTTISGTVATESGINVVAACGGVDQISFMCAGASSFNFDFVSGGAFEITGLAAGPYSVLGGTTSPTGPLTDYANVTVTAGQTLTCNIDAARHLDCAGYTSIPTAPPPPPTRVVGTMDGSDAFAVLACSDGGTAFGCAGNKFGFVDLATGSYQIPELTPGTWTITGGRSTGTVATESATIDVVAGETTTCTFVGSTIDCGGTAATVPAGGSVSTATPGGQTAEDPLGATITTPDGGAVTIDEGAPSAPDGYEAVGQSWTIEAPDATVADPLTLVFDVDASLLPVGATHETLEVFRNGVPIAACATGDGTATPDPCVSLREATAGGDVRLTVLSSHASVWSLGVLADDLAPTITITPPVQGATYQLGAAVAPTVVCADEVGGSGLASCTYGTVHTATVGTKAFSVTATDGAGNTTTVTQTYRVAYAFEGFEAPFIPLSVPVTLWVAGATLPVRFSLDGDQGGAVLASGSPRTRPVSCLTFKPLGAAQSATGSLSYSSGADRYTFGLKAPRAWSRSCRELIVELADGTVHRAVVVFI